MKGLLILAILAVLTVILAACGGSNDEAAVKKDSNAPFSTGPSAPPSISTPTTPQPK
ncbi:hypothetical protein HZA42_04270 [Candidatus Peregrinibacteria bacterium]|nr:hypothetical protein [Candidatus Peregrinibacteria bacterium]